MLDVLQIESISVSCFIILFSFSFFSFFLPGNNAGRTADREYFSFMFYNSFLFFFFFFFFTRKQCWTYCRSRVFCECFASCIPRDIINIWRKKKEKKKKKKRKRSKFEWRVFPPLCMSSALVCMYVCVYVCMYVCMYVLCPSLYVCLYVCVYSALVSPAPPECLHAPDCMHVLECMHALECMHVLECVHVLECMHVPESTITTCALRG